MLGLLWVEWFIRIPFLFVILLALFLLLVFLRALALLRTTKERGRGGVRLAKGMKIGN